MVILNQSEDNLDHSLLLNNEIVFLIHVSGFVNFILCIILFHDIFYIYYDYFHQYNIYKNLYLYLICYIYYDMHNLLLYHHNHLQNNGLLYCIF